MPAGIYIRTPEMRTGKYKRIKPPWNKGKHIYCGGKRFEKGHIPWIKGKKRLDITGEKNPRWKGGKTIHSTGYIQIYLPSHPFKDNTNYIFEHRLVMEKRLGRDILKGEVVHHINGIRDDNRIENYN